MAKVFLGVGHGGSDPGAVGYVKEADVNLNMALGCKDYLEANGVQVGMSRTRDENDTLNEEIRECNAYNPDVCVDIHNNAGGGDGAEVYYHHLGGRSKVLAQNIEAEIKAIGQNSRGCKTRLNSRGNDYYGFIRETKASAVIVEGLFVDNKNDVKIADTVEEQRAFGVAIAKGILKTLGITPTQKPTNITPTLKYKVGDKVNVSSYYASSNDPVEKAIRRNATGTITKVLTNGCHNPYLLDNGALGWCNDGDIRGYATTAPARTYYPACNKKYNSITAALKSIGVNSSFDNRKKIATKNNIRNYTGTAQQNVQLLTKLKAGRLIK
jgi:N-acetylmuramoyl-L-alanine amidase